MDVCCIRIIHKHAHADLSANVVICAGVDLDAFSGVLVDLT